MNTWNLYMQAMWCYVGLYPTFSLYDKQMQHLFVHQTK